MNEIDYAQLSSKIFHEYTASLASKAMDERARNGLPIGCAPVGYRNVWTPEGKRIEIDPETALLIKEAFQMATRVRTSLDRILKELTMHRVTRNVEATMPLTNDDLKKIEGVMHKVATEVSDKQTEELAVAVAKGFEEVHEKFDAQWKYMDSRFTKIDATLYEHSNQDRKTRETLADHTKRLERIETKQDATETTLRDHGRRISELERTH